MSECRHSAAIYKAQRDLSLYYRHGGENAESSSQLNTKTSTCQACVFVYYWYTYAEHLKDLLRQVQQVDQASVYWALKYNRCAITTKNPNHMQTLTSDVPGTFFLSQSSRQASSVTARSHWAERSPGHHILHSPSLPWKPSCIWSALIDLIWQLPTTKPKCL